MCGPRTLRGPLAGPRTAHVTYQQIVGIATFLPTVTWAAHGPRNVTAAHVTQLATGNRQPGPRDAPTRPT